MSEKNGYSLHPKDRETDKARLLEETGLTENQILNLIDDKLIVDKRIDIFTKSQDREMAVIRKRQGKINSEEQKARQYAKEIEIENFETLKRNVETMELRLKGDEYDRKLRTQEERIKGQAQDVLNLVEDTFGIHKEPSNGDEHAFILKVGNLINQVKLKLGINIHPNNPEPVKKTNLKVNK